MRRAAGGVKECTGGLVSELGFNGVVVGPISLTIFGPPPYLETCSAQVPDLV